MTASPLLILALDQRPWLTQILYGHTGPATPAQRAATTRAKHMVLDGLLAAVADGTPTRQQAGILVDAELGPGVSERASAAGVRVSMPLERAGLDVYEDEPVDVAAYLRHHAPDLAKVLVRYNPQGDAGWNALQLERLAHTSRTAREAGCRFLFELLVPGTPAQVAAVGGEAGYAEQVRPGLALRAMQEIAAQVGVDVWKLEHLGPQERYRDVVELAAGHDATCVLLGAGAPTEEVDRWLATAAAQGFSGFAVGRSIWWDAVRGLLDGSVEHADAVRVVAGRYAHFCEVFLEARAVEHVGVDGGRGAHVS